MSLRLAAGGLEKCVAIAPLRLLVGVTEVKHPCLPQGAAPNLCDTEVPAFFSHSALLIELTIEE